MKTLNALILLTLTLSCSSKKAAIVAPDEYLKLNKAHASKHKSCFEQKKNLLTKAVTESEDAELDDENHFFVRNEKLAISYMSQFDLNKFTLRENLLETSAMIDACVVETDKTYKRCDTLMPTFNYFRGMIYGLRQYQWSKPTQERAIKQILSYLNYVTESQSNIMEIIFANDLLMRLADLGLLEEKVYAETLAFRKEAEESHRSLKKSLRKLTKKELQCKDAQEFYALERIQVVQLSESFSKVLKKTSKE